MDHSHTIPKPSLDVLTMGETMMAFEALEPGPFRENRLLKKWIGGAEDNVVIGLARLGFSCGWFSRLGDDEFGHEILRTIRGEGIDVSRVIMDPDAQTGVFFVESAGMGDPRCYYYRRHSAASRLSVADLDPEYMASARYLYLTGITSAISTTAQEASQEYIRIALEHKRSLVFDPNLRLKIMDLAESRRVLIPMMQKSHYVLPGDQELMLLMESPDLDQAIERAHGMGIANLVIKKGSEGALLALHGQDPVHLPPVKTPKPVSSMGAGDCFAAGFLAGLLKERPLQECVRWGNALGAFCVLGSGPYQTLPDYPEFISFVKGEETVNR